jgi:hypothetical protein
VWALLAGCESTDQADQRAARRLCALPAKAAVLAWRGFPAEAGFGQREGLELSGTFALPLGFSLGLNGYRPMPWPAARAAVDQQFKLGALLEGRGWARCQTAGDNVLEAPRTVSCDRVTSLADVIICTVDPDALQVKVTIKTAY